MKDLLDIETKPVSAGICTLFQKGRWSNWTQFARKQWDAGAQKEVTRV